MSSIRLLNFFINESLLYFGDSRNNVAFFKGRIPHQTSIKRVVFSDCSRLKTHKVCTATIKTLCDPSYPTSIFTTQILGGHVTTSNQGLSSNDKGRQKREPGNKIEPYNAMARKNVIATSEDMENMPISSQMSSRMNFTSGAFSGKTFIYV